MRVGVLQIGARRKATVRAALQVVALIGDLSNTVPAAIVGHDAVLDVQRTARAIEQTTTATGVVDELLANVLLLMFSVPPEPLSKAPPPLLDELLVKVLLLMLVQKCRAFAIFVAKLFLTRMGELLRQGVRRKDGIKN